MYSLFKTFLRSKIEEQVNKLPKVHKNHNIEVAAIFLVYDNESLIKMLKKRADILYSGKINSF